VALKDLVAEAAFKQYLYKGTGITPCPPIFLEPI